MGFPRDVRVYVPAERDTAEESMRLVLEKSSRDRLSRGNPNTKNDSIHSTPAESQGEKKADPVLEAPSSRLVGLDT